MIASLSDVPLFAGLASADCAELERRLTRRDVPPQTAPVREEGLTTVLGSGCYVLVLVLVLVR